MMLSVRIIWIKVGHIVGHCTCWKALLIYVLGDLSKFRSLKWFSFKILWNKNVGFSWQQRRVTIQWCQRIEKSYQLNILKYF